MKDAARYPWWLGPLATAGAGLVWLLARTWRIDARGMQAFEARIAAGERCVFAFWHARMLPLVYTHRGRGFGVLISRHRDGELIARILEALGFVTGRGSSTRGGEEGLRDMLAFAERGLVIGITPDGPRGPAEQVKPGVVYLASRTGFPVVPVTSSAKRSWVFKSWDKFRVPQPFARVVVSYGEPIAVPRELDEAGAEAARVRIERAMLELTSEVARRSGEAA